MVRTTTPDPYPNNPDSLIDKMVNTKKEIGLGLLPMNLGGIIHEIRKASKELGLRSLLSGQL